MLSAGGGICDDCDTVGYLGKNAQIFTRRTCSRRTARASWRRVRSISSAPSALPYGAAFQITTPNAASIRKAALLRLGAVTHSTNMEQRYVPLSFSAGSGELTATFPQNANVAPPGVYMLFIIDAAGVPSVAKMVQVSRRAAAAPAASAAAEQSADRSRSTSRRTARPSRRRPPCTSRRPRATPGAT